MQDQPFRGNVHYPDLQWGAAVGSSRVAAIDGLRGLTACAVAVGSFIVLYTDSSADGAVAAALRHAVLLLVVLSGFLLYRPFVASVLLRRARPWFPRYYLDRTLRLLPAYGVVLACSVVLLGTPVLSPAGSTDATRLPLVPGELTGLELSAALVAVAAVHALVPPLWRAGHRRLRRVRGRSWAVWCMGAPALGLLGVGLIGRALLAWPRTEDAVPPRAADVGTALFGVTDLFALGMVAAVAVVALQRQPLGPQTRQIARRWVLAIGVTACALGSVTLGSGDTLPWGVASACALVHLLAPGRGTAARTTAILLGLRPVAHLGRIAYGTWLWSVPAAFWLQVHEPQLVGARGVVVALTATLLLAEATHWLLERPIALLPRPTPPPAPRRRHALPAFLPEPDVLLTDEAPPAGPARVQAAGPWPAAAQGPGARGTAPVGCFPLAVPHQRTARHALPGARPGMRRI